MSRAHVVGRCFSPRRARPAIPTAYMRNAALAVTFICTVVVLTLIGAVWLS
jgi:hypothetical protein